MNSYLKLSFSLCLIVAYTNVNIAQNYASRQELLEDKNIVWAGETKTRYVLANPQNQASFNSKLWESSGIVSKYALINLKEVNTQPLHFQGNKYSALYQTILDSAFLEKNSLYKDAACEQLFPLVDFMNTVRKVEFVETIDPKTKKKRTSHRNISLIPNDIQLIEVSQILYYDAKRHTFDLFVESIAPLYETSAPNAKEKTYKALYWVKAQQAAESVDYAQSNIAWTKRTIQYFDVNNFTAIKLPKSGKTLNQLTAQMVAYTQKNADTERVLPSFETPNFVAPEALKNIGSRIDTVFSLTENLDGTIRIADATEEYPQPHVKKWTLTAAGFDHIAFVQEWNYDIAQQKFVTTTSALAPLLPIEAHFTNWTNTYPCFVKLLHKNFLK